MKESYINATSNLSPAKKLDSPKSDTILCELCRSFGGRFILFAFTSAEVVASGWL